MSQLIASLGAALRLVAFALIFLACKLRDFANFTLKHTIEIGQRPLSWAMAKVLRRPQFSEQLNNWLLRHYPALHGHLLSVARRQGVMPPIPNTNRPEVISHDAGLQAITPHARRIYADLKSALAKQQGSNY